MHSPPPPPPGGYPPPPPGDYPPPPPGGYPPPPPPPEPVFGGYPPVPPPSYGYGFVPQATYGGFWIRVAAYLIDWVIGGVIGFALGFVIGIIAVITHPENPTVAATDLRPVTTVLGVLINMAYFTVQWTISGATIGQRLFRLRVVDADSGQPIGFGKALLRWIGLIISVLVCFVGVIWVAFDARKQGWADKIAGTVVLRE